MYSHGETRTPYDYIYIQSPRVDACRILLKIFKLEPKIKFHFFIKEGKTLAQLSALERGAQTINAFRNRVDVYVLDYKGIVALEVLDS